MFAALTAAQAELFLWAVVILCAVAAVVRFMARSIDGVCMSVAVGCLALYFLVL